MATLIQLKTNQLSFQPGLFCLSKITHEIIKLLKAEVIEKQICISSQFLNFPIAYDADRYEKGIDTRILIDGLKLKQLLYNLTHNSITFLKKKGNILIRLEYVAAEKAKSQKRGKVYGMEIDSNGTTTYGQKTFGNNYMDKFEYNIRDME